MIAMTGNDFFASPQPLGRPLPLDEHAVSVSLPTWADVVGYEEGDKRVTDLMKIGYPRFKVHACIEKLIELTRLKHCIEASQECLVLPTHSVASSFMKFLRDGGCLDDVSLISINYLDVHVVSYPAEFKGQGRKFWQHTGEIVSSRLIEDALLSIVSNSSSEEWAVTTSHNAGGQRLSASDAYMSEFRQAKCLPDSSLHSNVPDEKSQIESVLEIIKNRISSIIYEPPEQVTLCVSGMAAIFGALKSVQELDRQNNSKPGKIVVFGFPYLDTLKVRRCIHRRLDDIAVHILRMHTICPLLSCISLSHPHHSIPLFPFLFLYFTFLTFNHSPLLCHPILFFSSMHFLSFPILSTIIPALASSSTSSLPCPHLSPALSLVLSITCSLPCPHLLPALSLVLIYHWLSPLSCLSLALSLVLIYHLLSPLSCIVYV